MDRVPGPTPSSHPLPTLGPVIWSLPISLLHTRQHLWFPSDRTRVSAGLSDGMISLYQSQHINLSVTIWTSNISIEHLIVQFESYFYISHFYCVSFDFLSIMNLWHKHIENENHSPAQTCSSSLKIYSTTWFQSHVIPEVEEETSSSAFCFYWISSDVILVLCSLATSLSLQYQQILKLLIFSSLSVSVQLRGESWIMDYFSCIPLSLHCLWWRTYRAKLKQLQYAFIIVWWRCDVTVSCPPAYNLWWNHEKAHLWICLVSREMMDLWPQDK